jgi:hypothetical protein
MELKYMEISHRSEEAKTLPRRWMRVTTEIKEESYGTCNTVTGKASSDLLVTGTEGSNC